MARVFLSYGRDDALSAKALAETLGRSGHEVWRDRHIHGGARYAAEIDRALKESEAVIVLWSESSVRSTWVQDEAAEARDASRLIPVILDACKPPLGFRQFQTIDFNNWSHEADSGQLDELLRAILKTAGTELASEHPADRHGPAEALRDPSVCVLPFLNMSGDPEQEYFSDGITEDIITDLSKVSALSVIDRSTASGSADSVEGALEPVHIQAAVRSSRLLARGLTPSNISN